MSVKTINLHDPVMVSQLTEHLDNLEVDEKIGRTIIDAVEVLRNYKETVELSPTQVSRIFRNLQISDTLTPSQMNRKLVNNNKSYVIRKKFFDSYLSKQKFESALLEIIGELSKSVAGDILSAIVSLVKNFSLVCLDCQEMNTIYKEMCFKFFCRDDKRNEILLLIINLDYGVKDKDKSYFQRCCAFMRFGLHLSFFGAIVRTSFRRSSVSMSSVSGDDIILACDDNALLTDNKEEEKYE